MKVMFFYVVRYRLGLYDFIGVICDAGLVIPVRRTPAPQRTRNIARVGGLRTARRFLLLFGDGCFVTFVSNCTYFNYKHLFTNYKSSELVLSKYVPTF